MFPKYKYFEIFFEDGKKYSKGGGLGQDLIKIALKWLKYWKIVEYLDVNICFPKFPWKYVFRGDCKTQLFDAETFYIESFPFSVNIFSVYIFCMYHVDFFDLDTVFGT